MMAQDKNNKAEEPKIVIDDDWKAQAQAEKEKLAQQVDGQEQAAAGEGATRQLPPGDFTTLVTSLATQVFLSLGGIENPETKKRYLDLDLAKHHIDILAMLEQKTKGNLSDAEKKLLDQALYEVRMQYVQVAQNATRVR